MKKALMFALFAGLAFAAPYSAFARSDKASGDGSASGSQTASKTGDESRMEDALMTKDMDRVRSEKRELTGDAVSTGEESVVRSRDRKSQ